MNNVQHLDLPFRTDLGGEIRIGKSRVTLQSVIADFQRGASPEEIVHHFPSLDLAETYLAIGYYLQHQDEVDSYIRGREEGALHFRMEYQAAFGNGPLRERLLRILDQQRSAAHR